MKQFHLPKRIVLFILIALLAVPHLACDLAADVTTAAPSIVINEVVTSNGQSLIDEVYDSPDWIELKNIGSSRVSLLGFGITDNVQNTDKTFTLPDISLEPGAFVVLFANKEKTDLLSYEGGPVCIGFSLKSTGENLTLTDDKMQVVSELTIPELARDVSYARKNDGSYGFCAEPTPNGENLTAIYDTLSELPLPQDETEQVFAPTEGILFSEVSTRNNEALLCSGCAGCDWVELYNMTDQPIVMENFALTDDPEDYDKPNLNATIAAHDYLVIRCCKDDCDNSDGHICVQTGISRYGDHLYLFNEHGILSAEIEIPETLHKDMTYMRNADGSYVFTTTPTPGAENVMTEYVEEPEPTDAPEPIYTGLDSKVVINEVLPSNDYSIADRDGDRSDWVELYNQTSEPISLLGYYLTDSKDFQKWAFPDVTIPANGYLLVFLSGKEMTGDELHASFSVSEGETLKLYSSADNTFDQLKITASRGNVSLGRDTAGTIVYYGEPTPLSPNGHARSEADSFGFFQSDGVYISEVCAIHARGSGEDDWIELHNGGSEDVKLDGWYLTDDIDTPTKFRLPSLLLGAGDYTTVSVSKYQGNFSISPGGETLYLLRPDGRTVVDVFETGVQTVGMSSGRLETNPTVRRVFFSKPTKGSTNNSTYETGYTSDPTFSETALYQTADFYLTLSDLDKNAVIYYTTDGSEPSTKSNRYTEPIRITKNSVIRAYAVSDGLMDSQIVTYTYLYEQPHTVPVVCLSMSPSDFNTVYSVRDHSKITERKGYVNYYEADGYIGTSFPCDVKAKGRGTLSMAQKSLTLSLRAAYGQRTVDYPFFPDYEFTEFGAFALRNAGQDNNGKDICARLRDAYVSRACLNLNVDCANSRFVVLYVNGEYYGLYDFNEELNSRYLETHYGVDPDTVNTIMRNGSIAMKGDNKEFKSLFNASKNMNLSSDSKYESYLEKVDDDAFIDYVICRTFMLETDSFNQKYWRTTDYKIKWRPILYDLDYCFMSGADRDIMHLYFKKEGQPAAHGSLTHFYFTVALKTSPIWRQKFVERYVEVVMNDFSAERLLTLYDQVVSELEPEMERQIHRWSLPRSYSKWESAVRQLRNKIEKRPGVVLEQIRKEFNLSKDEMDAIIAKYSH